MNEPPPCKEGDRIQLMMMPEEPAPIPSGTQGTVMWTTQMPGRDTWQIVVKWDIARSLCLIWPVDRFIVIGESGKTLEEITGVGNGNPVSGNTDKD